MRNPQTDKPEKGLCVLVGTCSTAEDGKCKGYGSIKDKGTGGRPMRINCESYKPYLELNSKSRRY